MPLVLNSSSISGLAAVGGLSARQTGEVLQVVQGTYATQVTTSAGPVDTGLSASITPTSSSSKILVFVSQIAFIYSSGDCGCILNLLRGSTAIVTGQSHNFYNASTLGEPEQIGYISYQYLDSPATTSSTTYKTQVTATAGGNVAVNWNTNPSFLTLMEIAA